MNQKQRDYLIDRVSRTHRAQVEKIENKKPVKPSLNNYLIAAFLDNTIKFNDIESLKKKMREQVLRFGTSDHLVSEEDEWGSRRSQKHVKVLPEDLFIIPENYKKALDEYNIKIDEIEKQVETLDAQRQTIEMKIQIGSDKVLSKLIEQADNLADLQIMTTQLQLIA